jgi:two-component sensor histidine kinase
MAHDGLAPQQETRPHSLRLRLAVVLILASMPGVILGAMEAHRSFTASARTAQAQIVRTAAQVAARLDDVVASATILAESLAQSPAVRSPDETCNRTMIAAAEQSDRFGGVARLDSTGRVLCASTPAARGISVGDMTWFKDAINRTGPVLSAARIARVGGYQILSVSAPIRVGDRPSGLTVVSLRGDWMVQRAADADEEASIVLFDSDGVAFASVNREHGGRDVLAIARQVLSGAGAPGDVHAASAATTGKGIRVVAIAPTTTLLSGSRALLIAAAPLLAVLASLTAVWFALDRWVLRWIDRLVVHAEQSQKTQRGKVDLASAPPELQMLGVAFDGAIADARARASALSEALESNLNLNRELHHRVKNSLQVFASGLARQLRRTHNLDARDALLEARLRLLPFALTIQYSPSREDLTRIDTAGYIPELTRQIAAILGALSPGVALKVEADHLIVTNEIAAAIGMLIAESLSGAYLSGGGVAAYPLVVRFKVEPDGLASLECGVEGEVPGHTQHKLDEPLVTHLARQIGGEAAIQPGPLTIVSRPSQHDET